MKLKIGTIVTIEDGSWSLTIEDNLIVKKYGIQLDSEYEVVMNDCAMPVPTNGFYDVNDLLVREVNNKYFVFTNSSQVKIVPESCPLCGHSI